MTLNRDQGLEVGEGFSIRSSLTQTTNSCHALGNLTISRQLKPAWKRAGVNWEVKARSSTRRSEATTGLALLCRMTEDEEED